MSSPVFGKSKPAFGKSKPAFGGFSMIVVCDMGYKMRDTRYEIQAALVMTLLVLALPVKTGAYEPTENYETRRSQGWILRVNRQFLQEDAELANKVLRHLKHQLYQITRAVPPKALARLQEIPIWIERAHPRHPCMCYHISADWLREHDMNPEKAGAVEIANANNFLAWTNDQPWMVLHELSHAYHHKVLGHDHPEIKAAYERAKASKTYEKVLHINGKIERHYALANDQEYFAEMTEAYFGTNDFFPFVRAELKQHDPQMFELLGKLWEKRPKAALP